MSGLVELEKLLASLSPVLSETEYVFCSLAGTSDAETLNPLATFKEEEGLSLVISQSEAIEAGIDFESTFRLITLNVHSSLDAVGLTAAVSGVLAEKGISANVIAACFHDHILVPSQRANDALAALRDLSAFGR